MKIYKYCITKYNKKKNITNYKNGRLNKKVFKFDLKGWKIFLGEKNLANYSKFLDLPLVMRNLRTWQCLLSVLPQNSVKILSMIDSILST